jgi:hypothetical protein
MFKRYRRGVAKSTQETTNSKNICGEINEVMTGQNHGCGIRVRHKMVLLVFRFEPQINFASAFQLMVL